MKLTQLQQLAEARIPDKEETNIRGLFNELEGAIETLRKKLEGPRLKNVLIAGQYPSTETAQMMKKFNEFYTEFDDVKMNLLITFDENM